MNRPRRKTMGVSLAMGGPGDPADLDLTAEEATFNLSDGSASPGWLIDGDVEDGPVAVVVHGHRDSRFGSLYRAQMLGRYVSKVAVFDLPGHGDAQASRCLMGAREADDVHAVVDGLPEEMVRGRGVVVLGYSMGAVIVLKAAADRPERFAGVVLCAPYRLWDEGLRGQMRRRHLPQWPTVMLVGWVLRLAWGRWGLGERPGFDGAEQAARVPCPVLVLHGEADDICPLDAGQKIAAAAPAGELVQIADGTHNQLLAADYDAVHAALGAFFGRVAAGEVGVMGAR